MTTFPTTQNALRRAGTWITALLAAIVILSLFASCVHTAKIDSVSWDESQHLYSGWLSWERGDFGYNPEVPPLVKMWDAIPLLHRDIKQPAYTGDPFKKEGFVLGQRFLVANGIERPLIPARIMASLLTVLLATTLFFCAMEMFGKKAALFALFLFSFDPNFLAHGAYVTTDIGASLTMLAAIYAFYRYVKVPSIPRMIAVGAAVGLAMTAKFTGVFIVPVLCLIAAIDLLAIKECGGWCQDCIGSANVHSDRSRIDDRGGMRLDNLPFPLCRSTRLPPTKSDERAVFAEAHFAVEPLGIDDNERASRPARGLHLRVGRHEDLSRQSPELFLRTNLPGRFALVFPSCLPHQEHAAIPDSARLNDHCCF